MIQVDVKTLLYLDNFCKVLTFIFLIVHGPVLLNNFFERIFEK